MWLKHDTVHIDASETEFPQKSIFLPEKKDIKILEIPFYSHDIINQNLWGKKYETQLSSCN